MSFQVVFKRLGIAVTQRKFSEIARATVDELNKDLAAGTGKKIYEDYIGIINKYFVPFFGERYLQNIKHTDVAEFERWRNERLGKKPKPRKPADPNKPRKPRAKKTAGK